MNVHIPGIHFGLEEAVYHADPSLSNSGILKLRVSPLTYWMNSSLNPDRVEEETEAKIRGKAFHKRLLEGADVFKDSYAVKPNPDDYPGLLDGVDTLRKRCEALGLKKNGTLAEMAARIHEVQPNVWLWPLIMAEFEGTVGDRIPIPFKLAAQIERHAKIVESHPGTEKAFRGGHSEVSIFWVDDETGVPMKVRVDYLKIKAAVDIKTFTNPMDLPLDEVVARNVATNKHMAQAVTYIDGIEQAKALYRKHGMKVVYGTAPPAAWLDAFAEPAPHAFMFVFLEAGNVPNVRIREIRRTERQGASENLYWQAGQAIYRQGIARFKECLDHYGTELPWVDPQPARPFVDTDFPGWAFE